MTFFRDMPARVWDFISPRKTQKRRDKPFKVPAVPLKVAAKKAITELTPEKKVAQWAPPTPSSSTSVDYTLLPPSSPMSLHRDYEEDFDFEGDTLVHDSVEILSKDDNPPDTWHDSVEVLPKDDSATDAWNANDGALVDEMHYGDMNKRVNRAEEERQQEIQHQELVTAGWSEDAVFLFQKLNMRGFEPILPDDWKDDFPTVPLGLFTKVEPKQFIKAQHLSTFRAQNAFTQLFNLGGFARDAVFTKAPRRTAERHIIRAVNKYSAWAMQDGGMKNINDNLNIFTTVSCGKHTAPRIAEQKMIRKLHDLCVQWDDAFLTYDKTGVIAAPEEIPTLYGVIASHTIMAFVSYVLPTELNRMGSLRTIAIFDFGVDGYDVWNAFAIAIFCIHCRNRMQELQEYLPEPVVSTPDDPDL